MKVDWLDGKYGVSRALTPFYSLEMTVKYSCKKGGFVSIVKGSNVLVASSCEAFGSCEQAKKEAERLAVCILKNDLGALEIKNT